MAEQKIKVKIIHSHLIIDAINEFRDESSESNFECPICEDVNVGMRCSYPRYCYTDVDPHGSCIWCNICGRRDEIVFHCPNGYCRQHDAGFDYCFDCAVKHFNLFTDNTNTLNDDDVEINDRLDCILQLREILKTFNTPDSKKSQKDKMAKPERNFANNSLKEFFIAQKEKAKEKKEKEEANKNKTEQEEKNKDKEERFLAPLTQEITLSVKNSLIENLMTSININNNESKSESVNENNSKDSNTSNENINNNNTNSNNGNDEKENSDSNSSSTRFKKLKNVKSKFFGNKSTNKKKGTTTITGTDSTESSDTSNNNDTSDKEEKEKNNDDKVNDNENDVKSSNEETTEKSVDEESLNLDNEEWQVLFDQLMNDIRDNEKREKQLFEKIGLFNEENDLIANGKDLKNAIEKLVAKNNDNNINNNENSLQLRIVSNIRYLSEEESGKMLKLKDEGFTDMTLNYYKLFLYNWDFEKAVEFYKQDEFCLLHCIDPNVQLPFEMVF